VIRKAESECECEEFAISAKCKAVFLPQHSQEERQNHRHHEEVQGIDLDGGRLGPPGRAKCCGEASCECGKSGKRCLIGRVEGAPCGALGGYGVSAAGGARHALVASFLFSLLGSGLRSLLPLWHPITKQLIRQQHHHPRTSRSEERRHDIHS